MDEQPLAAFKAKDGTGRWEVYPWGLKVGGTSYHFTKQSHIVCGGLPGRSETHSRVVEEDDPAYGLAVALGVYQETGSWTDAGLAAWALGGSSVYTEVSTKEVPGNVTLSIGHLRVGRTAGQSLRYREDGRWVQLDAIQRFATVTKAAITAYRGDAR